VNLLSIFPHSKVPPTHNRVHRFIDDLVQETRADEDELHQAVSSNAD
jgi:hypothetical protein